MRRLLPLGLALAITLAGCADGDSTEAPDDTPTPTAAAGGGDAVAITGIDYGFDGVPETVAAGTELTFANASDAEAHEMVVMRIDDAEERSVQELLELPEEEAGEVTTFEGVAVAMPGEEGVTPEGPVVLDVPGRYVLLCFIPTGADPAVLQEAIESEATEPPQMDGGPPHFTQGMVAELTVE